MRKILFIIIATILLGIGKNIGYAGGYTSLLEAGDNLQRVEYMSGKYESEYKLKINAIIENFSKDQLIKLKNDLSKPFNKQFENNKGYGTSNYNILVTYLYAKTIYELDPSKYYKDSFSYSLKNDTFTLDSDGNLIDSECRNEIFYTTGQGINGFYTIPVGCINWVNSGIFSKFYKEGKLAFNISIHNGMYNGESIWYHENGTIQAKGLYKSGKLTGSFKLYNIEGELVKENFYNKDGKFIETKNITNFQNK